MWEAGDVVTVEVFRFAQDDNGFSVAEMATPRQWLEGGMMLAPMLVVR